VRHTRRMTHPTGLLARPVEEASRILALRFLEDVANAAPRVLDPKDDEGLHDFRVALRRLRSIARAYKPWIKSSVSKKRSKKLGAIARSTNEGRDTEVLLGWLQQERELLAPRHRTVLDALASDLEGRKTEAYSRGAKRSVAAFSSIADELRERLSTYDAVVRIGQVHASPTLANVLADLLQEGADELQKKLENVRDGQGRENGHEARLAAKRIRYLIESLSAELPASVPVVRMLKELQDHFGSLHDLHVLGIEIAARATSLDGAERVGAHVEKRGAEIFATIEKKFLGTRAKTVADGVRALSRGLHESSNEGVEIERKYLLSAMPPVTKKARIKKIDQGYLPGEKLIERVRRVQEGKRVRYFRTVKLGTGVSRVEVEEETTRDVFEPLWALTKGRRVEKTRYVVSVGDRAWEIDRFDDRDLVLAEIELKSENEPVVIPDWLAPCVVREVTNEARYVNAKLAK
jgi:CHAD domain-containing protein/CYTH domain-containing protein